MAPLGAVEDLAAAQRPTAAPAVVTVADARKGERLVLVATDPAVTRSALAGAARAAGRPEIYLPRTIVQVAAIPVLGTGKTDYVGRQPTGRRSSVWQSSVVSGGESPARPFEVGRGGRGTIAISASPTCAP